MPTFRHAGAPQLVGRRRQTVQPQSPALPRPPPASNPATRKMSTFAPDPKVDIYYFAIRSSRPRPHTPYT